MFQAKHAPLVQYGSHTPTFGVPPLETASLQLPLPEQDDGHQPQLSTIDFMHVSHVVKRHNFGRETTTSRRKLSVRESLGTKSIPVHLLSFRLTKITSTPANTGSERYSILETNIWMSLRDPRPTISVCSGFSLYFNLGALEVLKAILPADFVLNPTSISQAFVSMISTSTTRMRLRIRVMF